MQINIDIEPIVASSLTAEKLVPVLDKHISEAIKSAISDATGYSSQFQKALKVQLAEALPHGLGGDDLVKFQHYLNHALKKVLDGANNDTIQAALDAAVRQAMPDVKPVIKLSEFIDIARYGFYKEKHDAFYAYWEPCEHGGGGWLYLDEDENPGSRRYSIADDKKYSAKHRLAVSKDGSVYALRLDAKDITPSSRPDIIGTLDTVLMAMYVGRTRLELDIDADDVAAAAEAQYQ
jgi:hypothetical protein